MTNIDVWYILTLVCSGVLFKADTNVCTG